MFYRDTFKEKNLTDFYTSIFVTVIVTIYLMSIYQLVLLLTSFIDKLSTEILISLGIVLWSVNYFLIIRKKTFFNYQFKKDKKGGILIVLFLFLTIIGFLILANINRSKILA